MAMDAASIASGLNVLRCNSGVTFDFASCGVVVAGSASVFDDRLLFAPSADLPTDTWYWVGVPVGARARANLGGRSLAGLNFDSNGDSANDMYAWSFKTRASAGRCQIRSVEVDPPSYTFTQAGDTKDFFAAAVDSNQCSIITTPNSWTWNMVNSGVAAIDSFSDSLATARAVANGSTQLQARLAGFSSVAFSNITVDLPNPLRLGAVTGGQCRNSVITAEFTRTLNPATVAGNILVEESTDSGTTWTSIGATASISAAGYGRTMVTLTPPGLLTTSSLYRLWIRGGATGVRDQLGQMLQDDDGSFPAFRILSLGVPPRQVCAVNRVEVSRNTAPVRLDTFFCANANNCSGDDDVAAAGNQHKFRAQAKAASGDIVTATYRWTVARGPNLVTVTPNPATEQDVTLTAGNQNGSATLVVDATNDYGSARGSVGVRLFLCSNPWPSPDASGNWGPFLDNDTGFSLFYCRDDGSPATTTDDLPALPAPTRRNTTGDLFREIIFLPGAGGGEVNPTNGNPYIDYLPNITINENQEVRFNVNAHDPENDTLSFAPGAGFSNMEWSPVSPLGPQLLNLGSSALFTWRPSGSQGGDTHGYIDYNVTFRVRDSAGAIGSSNSVRIRVVDATLPEPVPAPPASVFVTFTAGDLVNAAGSLSWNPSNFAATYRVYRRDDGAAGGGEGDVSYQPNIQSALRRLVNAVRHWVGQVVSPIARVFNIPVGYASTFEEGIINPSG